MVQYVCAIILLLLACIGIVVKRTIFAVPLHERKRIARTGDRHDKALYRVAASGNAAKGLLWIWISLTSAGGLALVSAKIPVWASFLLFAFILWFAFSWLSVPNTSRLASRLTDKVVPLLNAVLNYLYPPLAAGGRLFEKHHQPISHTGLYEREDILKLLHAQAKQEDNRVSEEELDIAIRALEFDDHLVDDVTIPASRILSVLESDVVGPILIDEIHKSGHDVVVVLDKKNGTIVGTLAFQQLTLHSTGTVSDYMDHTVYYLHTKDRLSEALHAFYTTNRSRFVVIDNSGDYVGIVTIGRLLEQLLGHIPGNDFDQYTDKEAVQRRHLPKTERSEPADDDVDDVIEL